MLQRWRESIRTQRAAQRKQHILTVLAEALEEEQARRNREQDTLKRIWHVLLQEI